jgi:hypothetical protein
MIDTFPLIRSLPREEPGVQTDSSALTAPMRSFCHAEHRHSLVDHGVRRHGLADSYG